MKRLHYSWIMVASAVGILATNMLAIYSFGVFLRPLTEQFGWERGAASAAFSIGMLAGGPISIFTGRLSDRYGPRLLVTASGLITGIAFVLLSQIQTLWQLYAVYGVMLAIGGSGAVVPIASTIPRWFERRRGIALGLTWTGTGLGGIITPILSQWLISGQGWRGAYVTLGVINLVVVMLLAQLLRRDPQQVGLEPYGAMTAPGGQPPSTTAEGFSLRKAIRTGRFWFFGAITFSFVFTMQVMIGHIPAHAVDVGISATLAASVVSIFAATSLIGRNLAGFISDRIGPTLSVTGSLMVMALALVWLLFAREVWMFYVFAAIYGIGYGGIVPMQSLVTGELFGLRSLGVLMASLMVLGSVGGALGISLAGAIFDNTGSYQAAFLIALGLVVLAFILGIRLVRMQRNAREYPASSQGSPSLTP